MTPVIAGLINAPQAHKSNPYTPAPKVRYVQQIGKNSSYFIFHTMILRDTLWPLHLVYLYSNSKMEMSYTD